MYNVNLYIDCDVYAFIQGSFIVQMTVIIIGNDEQNAKPTLDCVGAMLWLIPVNFSCVSFRIAFESR